MKSALIEVDGLSKKFCRSLKRSLWYGIRDVTSEIVGINIERGSLRPGEFWAIEDLSLSLHRGETLGLIGGNGAGKTTLLRILNGLIKPDKGTVTVRGRMQALIALGAGFNPVLTGRENIYVSAAILGIPKAEVDRRFESIVEFSGIPEFIDSPVQNYSSGMAVRLGFAVAAHLEPDILLVDEVLAVGDEGFQVKCLNKIGQLKHDGTAIILVSHNMHAISTYCDLVLVKTSSTHQLFDDVAAGVMAYKSLVHETEDSDLEKHTSGTSVIQFTDVEIENTSVQLGEDFHLILTYNSTKEYKDIEIDLAIRVIGETGWHHQATNRTFGQRIDLHSGIGTLDICLRNPRIIQSSGKVSISVWAQGRSELLFWWRIPVDFTTIKRASGIVLYEMEITLT